MIETAMIRLVKEKPFFAHLLMTMSRNVTTEVPTVGVNVTDKVNLYINPYFWDSLSLEEQVDILIHECMHVLNNHFERFKVLQPEVFSDLNKKDKTVGDEVVKRLTDAGKFRALNVAADLAINEYLPNLPKKFKGFDSKGNVLKDENGKPLEMRPCLVTDHPDFARYKHTEYYFEKIKENSKSKSQGQSGGEGKKKKGQGDDGYGYSIDDHEIWAQGNPDSEYVLEKIKQAVDKAVEASGGMQAGNIPGDVQVLIEKLRSKTKNWKAELQRFVSKSSEVIAESSRKIRNRRYGIVYPGTKYDPKLNLVVAIDSSGSIDEETLSQFMAEIDKIHKTGAVVTIIECDAKVQQVQPYDPRKKIEIKGRGGTDFSPAFQEAEKMSPDALIYFTDGEDYGQTCKKPPFPVLWALMPKCDVRYDWGRKLHIEINKKAAS